MLEGQHAPQKENSHFCYEIGVGVIVLTRLLVYYPLSG
jgi:hypothetical protein